MLYSSRNGCLFYYDSVLYSWKIADPSLLFLLGLEAVTSYSTSQSDNITLYKNVYYRDTDVVETMESLDSIYDTIYSYLSTIGSVEDFESYLKFNCFGLKLFLNSLTGTGNDRTIPVIFKSDANRSVLDTSKKILRTTESYRLNGSIYDLQAKIIYNIFLDAGYNLNYNSTAENPTPKPEYYLPLSMIQDVGISEVYTEEIRSQLIKDFKLYDNNVESIHEQRLANGKLYCLLDYKAMYSYALGVLYGCRCLGYSDNIIWRMPPRYWYNGDYRNLVNTAWLTFRFHWTNKIENTDIDSGLYEKYQSIQNNKIWNYTNDFEQIYNYSLESDEVDCFCLSTTSNSGTSSPVSEQIVYSFSKTSNDDLPGSYLKIESTSSEVTYTWTPISEKVHIDDSMGLVSSKDDRMIRYIGNDRVYMYKAYTYTTDGGTENRICPQDTNYFVYTGGMGWVNYDKDDFNSYVDLTHNPAHKRLAVAPHKPKYSDLSRAARKLPDNTWQPVYYYKCYVVDGDSESTSKVLYGFYISDISNENNIPNNFDEILYLTSNEFSQNYTDMPTDTSYSPNKYYNLQDTIWLITKTDSSGNIYVWDNDSTADDKKLGYYGYSVHPSSEITVYTYTDNTIAQETYRQESVTKLLWYENMSEEVRDWVSKSTLATLLPDSNVRYCLTTDQYNFYRCDVKLLTSEKSYRNFFDSTDTDTYVYIQDSTLQPYGVESGFIPIMSDTNDSLYSKGITTNVCTPILYDDYGNQLTDEDGNPLVWYNPKATTDKYWNGLFNLNRWQSNKPSAYNSALYDSYLNEEIPIYIDYDAHRISIDGAPAITYEEFYSNPHYGIIKYNVQVFNPSVSESIIDCYCDTKDDPEHPENFIYCIPSITENWVSRSDISALGYRFVDGTDTLYDGETTQEVVYDDDDTD